MAGGAWLSHRPSRAGPRSAGCLRILESPGPSEEQLAREMLTSQAGSWMSGNGLLGGEAVGNWGFLEP